MFIAGIDYYLMRKTLEIYIIGCKPPHCESCHNPELQIFVSDDNVNIYKEKIKNKIETGMIKEVWIMGGEPLDQDINELQNFIKYLKTFDIKIWLWTGYDDYKERIDISLIDYVKHGKYIENLPSYTDKESGIVLASSNQKVKKIGE